MPYTLYDHVNVHGKNTFKEWTEELQTVQLAGLNAKLHLLTTLGPSLFPEILAGSGTKGIWKLKIKGKVQLRPMLCAGPVNPMDEYTLLLGAKEIGDQYSPKDADKKAAALKDQVKSNPTLRRKLHEHVGKASN